MVQGKWGELARGTALARYWNDCEGPNNKAGVHIKKDFKASVSGDLARMSSSIELLLQLEHTRHRSWAKSSRQSGLRAQEYHLPWMSMCIARPAAFWSCVEVGVPKDPALRHQLLDGWASTQQVKPYCWYTFSSNKGRQISQINMTILLRVMEEIYPDMYMMHFD